MDALASESELGAASCFGTVATPSEALVLFIKAHENKIRVLSSHLTTEDKHSICAKICIMTRTTISGGPTTGMGKAYRTKAGG